MTRTSTTSRSYEIAWQGRNQVTVCVHENLRSVCPLCMVHPNRTALHKYMAPADSCSRCHGRGYHPSPDENDPTDLYCDCPAGDERRRVEA